jgi:hypothetical protein
MIGYTGFKGKYWCLKCVTRQSVEVANTVCERFNTSVAQDEQANVHKLNADYINKSDYEGARQRMNETINKLKANQQ